MRERRGIRDAREIIGILRNLPPVVIAAEHGEHFRPHGLDGVRREEVARANRHEQHQQELRIDAPDALSIVREDPEESLLRRRADARVGEEVPRQHEEQRDAEVAADDVLREHVKEGHAQDCERAQGIQPCDMTFHPLITFHPGNLLFLLPTLVFAIFAAAGAGRSFLLVSCGPS